MIAYLKKTRERTQDLPVEEKEKKQQYHHDKYKNLSDNEKQRLVDCRKNCYKVWKNAW